MVESVSLIHEHDMHPSIALASMHTKNHSMIESLKYIRRIALDELKSETDFIDMINALKLIAAEASDALDDAL